MERTKPSCCRRLFDTDGTPGEMPGINAYFAEETRKARERWNYDFEKDEPLEGRYEWVRVAPPSPTAAPKVRRGEVKLSKAGEKKQEGSMQTENSQVTTEGAEETVRGGQDTDMEEAKNKSEEVEEQSTNLEQPHD